MNVTDKLSIPVSDIIPEVGHKRKFVCFVVLISYKLSKYQVTILSTAVMALFFEEFDERCKLLPEDLSESVMKELECPVCMEYMVPPILLCENGHNVCSKCRPHMKKCPTCRQHLLNTRNVSLENLTRRILYPCRNQKTGCEEFYSLEKISRHQNICIYRYYQCPLSKAPGVLCLWEGPRAEIMKHVQKNHKDRLTEAITKLSVFIQEFQPTYKYCRAISALGELFYQQFHVEGTDFFFVVQFVGPEETASEFKYEVTIKSPTGVEKIAITQVTQSVKVTVEDICEAGECIKLHYDVIKHFLGHENNLRFELEISRIEETKL